MPAAYSRPEPLPRSSIQFNWPKASTSGRVEWTLMSRVDDIDATTMKTIPVLGFVEPARIRNIGARKVWATVGVIVACADNHG